MLYLFVEAVCTVQLLYASVHTHILMTDQTQPLITLLQKKRTLTQNELSYYSNVVFNTIYIIYLHY